MKEKIVKKAITLIYKNGLNKFSVRLLAKSLKLSTRPIYYYFKNLTDLYSAIKIEVLKILQIYISKDYTENNFLNSGVGYVSFAQELPDYYNILMLKEFWPGQSSEQNDVDNMIRSNISKFEQEIYQIMKTYTLGMAMQASALPNYYTLEKIIELQTTLFNMLITSHGKDSKNSSKAR